MGERTQLFINVTDENNEKLLGTVIHYQWGIKTKMLLDELHIATNLRIFQKPMIRLWII